MKITIVGGGNMGGAIALGLAAGSHLSPKDITVINRRKVKADGLKDICPDLNAVVADYESLATADIVILALKPWLIESFLLTYRKELKSDSQLLISVAAGISLDQLEDWTHIGKPLFGVMPNTAVAVKQSMTFVTAKNAREEQIAVVSSLFEELGKVEVISENVMAAGMSLASCGIAYAFRYIRASMEGGVELGLYPNQSKEIVIQTLRGAIELLESTGAHPEQEIDKVTTAGGITIKGLNELEHAGFTSAVIRGLKASCVKK